MQRPLTVFLALLLLLPWLCAADHLRTSPPRVSVAPTGNDSTACGAVSKATPRRSINGGLACLTPGGTLEVADGTYDELLVGQVDGTTTCQSSLAAIQQPCAAVPNGTDADHQTTIVAAGAGVIVSPRGRDFPGGGGIVTLFSTSRNLRFEGLRFVTNEASGSASGFLGGDAQHITVTRSEFDNGTMKSSPNSQHFTVSRNHLHHAGRGCDQSTNPQPYCAHGMYLCGQHHTITDNLVEHSSYYGIQVSCEQGGISNVRIERNTVRSSYGVGIRCGGEHCTIASNLLVGNGTGITMSGSGVVAHNTIDGYRQGASDPWGIYLTWGTWGTWQVVDNVITRQKSNVYAIGDTSLQPPDPARVHHNLCDQSGNAGCPIQGAASAVYANVDAGDYSLKRTRDNPALGTGVPVAGVNTDIQGRSFHGEHPSLGAYAWQGTPPQPEPPQPPVSGLVLTCQGTVQAVPGPLTLQCVQQVEDRR